MNINKFNSNTLFQINRLDFLVAVLDLLNDMGDIQAIDLSIELQDGQSVNETK